MKLSVFFYILILLNVFINNVIQAKALLTDVKPTTTTLKKKQIENNDIKSKAYLSGGIGANGFSISASYYYNNRFGVRLMYSYAPSIRAKIINDIGKFILREVDFEAGYYFRYSLGDITILDLSVTAQDIVPKMSISDVAFNIGHGIGFDFSVRPFQNYFRIDIGIRYLQIHAKVAMQADVNLKNSLQKLDDTLNTNLITQIVEKIITEDYLQNTATVSGRLNIAKGFKPYFGIGFDIPLFKSNFLISLSLGLIYTGKFKIDPNYDVYYGGKNLSYYQKILDNKEQKIIDIAKSINTNASKQIETFLTKTLNVDLIKNSFKNVEELTNDAIPEMLFWPEITLQFTWRFDVDDN